MSQNLRFVRQRIKSIKNTRQITKAMELVASSRMLRSTQAVLESRDYSATALEIIHSLSPYLSEEEHLLLQKKKEIKSSCFLLLTTNKGLCGSLNNQIIAKVLSFQKEKKNVFFVTWGRKGRELVQRYHQNLLADFEKPEKIDSVPAARTVAKFLTQLFLENKVDEIFLVFAHFVSALKQVPTIMRLLPFKTELLEEKKESRPVYLFEPTASLILENLLDRVIQLTLYQAFLESFASEQASRMLAMRNATNNASTLLSELNLIYNQLRQSAITQELAEISASRLALENY